MVDKIKESAHFPIWRFPQTINLLFITQTKTISVDFRHDDGFYPLSSLDVICHEIGHAITDWHGGDMEYYDEMGGINEAYSDILGKTEKR